MKITLVQCPCFTIRNPPLGLAHLSGVLRAAGHEVGVYDFNIDLYSKYSHCWHDEYEQRWRESGFFMDKAELVSWVELFADKILATDPDVIGFSVHTTSVYMSRLVARRIKEKNSAKPIVFGGPECLREKPEFLLGDRSVDYIVQGEGEQTLLELLAALQNKSALDSCNGLIFMQDGALIKNAPRQPVDINSLPLPDFSLFERQRYLYPDVLPLITSRGCVRRCKFCLDTWYQHKHSAMTPERIVALIEKMVKDYAVKSFVFNDSLLNGNLKNLETMCDLMISRKIEVGWHCNLIVRPMSETMLDKIRAAGCGSVTLGIESGSQHVLDLMQKNFQIDEASLLVKALISRGIDVAANWIVGYPGEERKDLVKTARFVLNHREQFSLFTVSMLAINSPSPLSREAEKLQIKMDNNSTSVEWVLGANTPAEREHRYKVFNRLVENSAFLFEENNRKGLNATLMRRLHYYFERKKLLRKFIKELYS